MRAKNEKVYFVMKCNFQWSFFSGPYEIVNENFEFMKNGDKEDRALLQVSKS